MLNSSCTTKGAAKGDITSTSDKYVFKKHHKVVPILKGRFILFKVGGYLKMCT